MLNSLAVKKRIEKSVENTTQKELFKLGRFKNIRPRTATRR